MDKSIDPTADQVRALRDSGATGPVVMVNLLKFRAKAAYPEGSEFTAKSGEQAYRRYAKNFLNLDADIGAELILLAEVDQCFIGTEGAREADWDRVLIVRYPSPQHFLRMMADKQYQAGLVHRYAGLERTVLLRCHTM